MCNVLKNREFTNQDNLGILSSFNPELELEYEENNYEYNLVMVQYKKMKINSVKPSVFENIEKKGDSCPICYEAVTYNCKILGCPDCKNTFHKDCIEMWLKTGSNCVCPFCRSSKWKSYNRETYGYKNLFID